MSLKRKLIRFFAMRRHRSTVPTGLAPLSDLHSAVLFLDKPDDLEEPQKTAITRFFKQHGITLSFLYDDDEDLRTSSDLFISLSAIGGVNERYAATSSAARFKIGRHQLKGDVYDFVVTDGSPEPAQPMEAFKVVEHFILNIQ